MITKRLVEPAHWSIRLMDILNCIPVSLDLKTGKISDKGPQRTTRIVHYTLFYMSGLKCLQTSYTLFWLLIDFKRELLHVVILAALMLSLVGTSMFWASELFHNRLAETIILFNSLEYAPPDQLRTEAGPQDGKILVTNVGVHARRRLSLVLQCMKNWVHMVGGHARFILSLDLQESLCITTPFAVKLFVPLYIAMMSKFPDWEIFATSLVWTLAGAWWSLVKALILVFEILATYYTETNILFLFFFRLALQVTHITRFGLEAEKMR